MSVSTLTVGSDGVGGGILNNLLMCILSKQGIGSRMSSGPSGTIGGGGIMSVRDSLEITVDCGTVGVTEVVESSVGIITELAGDSGTIMRAGVSVEVNGSVDCLSQVSMLWLVRELLVSRLGSTGSW